MDKIRNRKGGIVIILLFILVFITAISSLFVFTETKTLDIKRRNIHNAVLAANLALFNAIEQGDQHSILQYTPNQLQSYIDNPSTIPVNERNDIVNLLSSEYFPKGERYKSVYMEKDKALDLFKEYLEDNLDLLETNENTFVPYSNDSYIKEIKIKEFFVHNALDIWDKDKNHSNNDIKNNKYTGVHVYLEATVYNSAKIYNFKGTTFRSKQ